MGTRSITTIFDQQTPIAAIYQQYDGDPTGVGQAIHEWAKGKRLVNGIRSNDNPNKIWNGAGCLAASLVAHLKEPAGR